MGLEVKKVELFHRHVEDGLCWQVFFTGLHRITSGKKLGDYYVRGIKGEGKYVFVFAPDELGAIAKVHEAAAKLCKHLEVSDG